MSSSSSSSSFSSSDDEDAITVIEQLSPFSSSGGDTTTDSGRIPPNNLQDELLVDISEIQPAGDNKNLFSIDEDSREGTPSKSSEFHVVELTDESLAPTLADSPLEGEERLVNNHSSFSPGLCPPPLMRRRSSDAGSTISDVSGGLFPIYEVPGVAFTAPPQSDLESCGSEWEDGGPTGSPLDRLSKDTMYQGFLRMRQRYHKYKGRYADLLRVFREKEREAERLRDVLTKHQDKALTRMSELREQCALEQQAKAHLEQELRSDLEEKDHKIEALQTKVRLLQEGCFGGPPGTVSGGALLTLEARSPQEDQGGDPCERVPSPAAPDLPAPGSKSTTTPNAEDFDTVSVGSLGSISTAPHSLEAEELIDKLRDDVAKHRSLLGRCMENIRANKERIATLGAERDTARAQLLDKVRAVDVLKADHERMMTSLRATVESSALSMAETKQRLFEELQTKEAEVELYRSRNRQLESDLERFRHAEESPPQVEEDAEDDGQDLVTKCCELENLVADLQTSKKNLELKLDRLENPSNGDLQANCTQLEGDKDSGFSLQEAEEEDATLDQQRREAEVRVVLNLPQQLEIEQLTSELRSLKEKNESLKMEVARLNEENEVLHNEFQVLRAEREVREVHWASEAEKWRENVAKLDANLKDKKAELREKEDGRMQLRTDMEGVVSHLEEDKAKLETALRQSEESIALLKESERLALEAKARIMHEVEELSIMKEDAEKSKVELEDAKKDLEKDREILQEKCLALTTHLQERDVRIEDLETGIQKANEKCAASTSLADQRMSMIETLKEDLKNLKNQVALTTKAREEADDLRRKLEETQTCFKREVDDKAAIEVKLGSIDAALQNLGNFSLVEADIQNKVEALCSESFTLKAQIADLKGELVKRAEEVEEQTKVLKKYSEDKDQMKASLDRVEEDLCKASSERDLSYRSLEDKDKDLLALRSTLAQSEDKQTSLEDEVATLTRALEAEKENARREMEAALALRMTLEEDLEDKSKAVETLNQSLVIFEEERVRLIKEESHLRSELAQTLMQKKKAMAALEGALQEADVAARRKDEHLKLEVERRESRINDLEKEVARLEGRLQEAMGTVAEAEAKTRLMEGDATETRRKLEEVRSEQDRRLEEVSRERWEKEGDLSRGLARKDAEIARLTDELDAAHARLQDAHEQAKETETAHADLRLQFESLQKDLDHLELLTKEAEGIGRTTLEDELRQKSSLIETMIKEEEHRLKELALLKEKNLELEEEVEALSQKAEAIEKRFQISLEEERVKGAALLQKAEGLRVEKTDLLAQVGALATERDSIKVDLENTLTSMEALQEATNNLADQPHRPKNEDEVSKPPTSSVDFMASLEDELKRERTLLSSLKDSLHGLLEQHEPGRTADEDDVQVLLEMVNEDRKVLMRRVEATEAEVVRLKQTDANVPQESAQSKETRRKPSRGTTVQAACEEALKPHTPLLVHESDSISKGGLDSNPNQSIEKSDFIQRTKPPLSMSTLALDSAHEEVERHLAPPIHEADTPQKEPCVAMPKRELDSTHPNPCYVPPTAPARQIGHGESGPCVNLRNLSLAPMQSQELESLARAASDAYRNGSASIERLKEQVAAQKSHIEELKRTHKREVSELEALLELKKRRNAGPGGPPPRTATPLEEAAEFEYLKNVLYQYMMGKETQTLSKVLCAVLKFSRDQQHQITLAEEERRQNIRREAHSERRDEAQQELDPPKPALPRRVRRSRGKVSSIAHGLRLQK